jgi:HD-like signal output (HDOD) protein
MTGRSSTETTDPVLAHAAAIVDAAAQLTPLSHSTTQLISLNSNPNVSTSDLVNVISADQVLTAAMLREANSAASAAANPISTVDKALVRLGMGRVLALAIRMSVSGHLSKPVPQYGLSEGELALLSVTGSVAAEIVRERSKVALPPEMPTSALLRDIGLLVLAKFIDEPVLMLLHVAVDSGAPLSDSERMVLDANHGEAGGLLCQTWKLPESVRMGVQYHHEPFACDAPIAHGVFLADVIAQRIAAKSDRSWSHSRPTQEAIDASFEELKIDSALLDSMVEATIERFESRDTGLTL